VEPNQGYERPSERRGSYEVAKTQTDLDLSRKKPLGRKGGTVGRLGAYHGGPLIVSTGDANEGSGLQGIIWAFQRTDVGTWVFGPLFVLA